VELEDLRIFLAVVRHGTRAGATEEAHLSQPAISRRLQALERELRAPLFERVGRRMQLTEAGVALIARAEAILGQVGELTAEMAAYGAGARGHLRIGATVTACLYLLPPIFRAFRDRHPEHPLLVRNDRSSRMADLLQDGRIDVGVASILAPRDGVQVIPWRELELALIRPPWAGDAPAAVATLSDAPIVLPSAGTLRTLTESLLARCDVAPPVVAECDSLEVVRALVAAGIGQAILPRVCVPADGPAVRVVALTDDVPPLPVAALVRRTRPTPRPVAAFLEALQSESE
jgi:DNA-binding transcriptional LysR family regulator